MNHHLRLLSCALLACTMLLSSGCTSDEPGSFTTAEETSHEAALTRGEYLVEDVAGCANCHTAINEKGQLGPLYAGGFEAVEPIGTWRSTNITQDVETGIGGWTDEEIITAIREGKRPDGSGLVVVMPYLVYNSISDEDAQAMVAYLRTIPAVSNTVERVLDFPQVPAPPAAGKPPAENALAQGEYMASLMHCVECHTPMGEHGPDMSRPFAGGMPFPVAPVPGTGMVWSSNITSDDGTGIGHYTEQDVIASLVEAKKPDGAPLLGPMNLYADRWARMKEDDLAALATFIKSIPAVDHEVAENTFEPAQ